MREIFNPRRWMLGGLVLVMGATGCSDGSPSGTLALQPSAASIEVAQGDSATLTVQVLRGGGFAGNVSLLLRDAPTGVNASFAPDPVPAGSTSSQLTLRVPVTAPVGTYPLNLQGGGMDVPIAQAPLLLAILPRPTLTLAVTQPSPGLAGVPLPSSSNATLQVTRSSGYQGMVTLSVIEQPDGFGATITPQTLASGASAAAVDFMIPAMAPAGTYRFRFRASSPGTETVEATASLEIRTP